MGEEHPGMKEILETYDLMFPEKSKKEIEKLKLDFNDLIVVVQEAVALIIGEDEQPGE